MIWQDILKTNFVFRPDDSEVGHFNRNTKEVTINLANKDFATSMGLSEDEFVDNLVETLAEEYTHEAIDDEVTEAWLEYLENNIGNYTPEELASIGHTMHEIGANAARGYSPLGTWLMVLGHANVNDRFKNWVAKEKIPKLIGSDIESKVLDNYNMIKEYLKSNGIATPVVNIGLISQFMINENKGVFSNVLA